MFQHLIQDYSNFHVSRIETNRFQPEAFHQVLDEIRNTVSVKEIGLSVEKRPIKMITLGTGSTKVLMWSQMHGNESTASRAILDLINFHNNPGKYQSTWTDILNSITLYIIPILNPDGTALFQRRNALNIDLNRDARDFTMPEAQILRDVILSLKPDYSFNLHDQRRFYNIQGGAQPSTISFLAPAFDKSEGENDTRIRSMQLIAALREELESVISGQVGLYDDSYSPRAFGDYAQAQGSSTILIESGWQPYDLEKEGIRKLNFALIITALNSITHNGHSRFSVDDYSSIPMNDEKMFDVLIRRVKVAKNHKTYSIDIGVQREEIMIDDSPLFYSKGRIEDLGDLEDWFGFDDIDASDLYLMEGKVLSMPLEDWTNLKEEEKLTYIKDGFLYLRDSQISGLSYTAEKINLISKEDQTVKYPDIDGPANFLLINKRGEIKYLLLNGFLWPIHEAPADELNGEILHSI